MSGGEQQMLAIARTLMGNPRLVLLSEQNLHFAKSVSDRAYIIEKERIRYQGLWPNWPPTRRSGLPI
jgi:branched-chain amino acid transport system ATP-binding protein